MVFKYNRKELAALDRKAENPESTVICPRCGKTLTYKSIGNSYEVKCPTANCLKETFRGL